MADFVSLSQTEEERAQKLHRESIIIDGLCYMRAPTEDKYLHTLIEAGFGRPNRSVALRPEDEHGGDRAIGGAAGLYARGVTGTVRPRAQ